MKHRTFKEVVYPRQFILIKIFFISSFACFTQCFPNEGSCSPTDCIIQKWTQWSQCSQTCGENGVRNRTRRILQEAECGGRCDYETAESEACNRRCCPRDCFMGNWYAWSCSCSNSSCPEPGERIVCSRFRHQRYGAECGGFCDDRTTEKKCDTLCCHRDCKYGYWSTWGKCDAPCEQLGIQTRKKSIYYQGQCGGEPCVDTTVERECKGSCCPTDCVQGDWSKWSDCSTKCGQGTRNRTRYVEAPICGGQACQEPVHVDYTDCEQYVNVDCKISPWSEWTRCELDNGYCGHGVKERARSVLVEGFCQGDPCPDLIQKKNCSGPCCVQDCVVSVWSQWSYCSATCGLGLSQRTRNVTVQDSCNGQECPTLMESRDCEQTGTQDCVYATWSEWTSCSTDCGSGVRMRSRAMVTPVYCGGTCTRELEQEEACTSYEARTDCQVTTWSHYSRCERNCDRGVSKRYRNITVEAACEGKSCPTKLVQTTSCHAPCSQDCNQGVCSCRPGYILLKDTITCKEISCPLPYFRNCPLGLDSSDLCKGTSFDCPDGYRLNSSCTASCSAEGYVVKGSPKTISCLKNKQWTANSLYCGIANKPPIGIKINATEINENWPIGTCFAFFSTQVDNEPSDRHTYRLISNPADLVKLKGNKLCLNKEASYETEKYREFDVEIQTTDIDGASITRVFHLSVLNANDPPRSVELIPNTIPENSKEGTLVGCLVIKDDDPGQTMSVFLISSSKKTFSLTTRGDQTCVQLSAISDSRCYTVGGKFCALDYETRDSYIITILVQDNGQPAMMTVFDLSIKLEDVNEKPFKLTLDPLDVLEEVQPGETLAHVIVEDDKNQGHTFEIVSDPSNLFDIKGDQLVASQKLDHELLDDKQYQLEIRVEDDGVPPMEATLQLVFGVGDVNEPPYDLHVTSQESGIGYETDRPKVKENVAGQIIGTLSVYDPDADETIAMKVISTYSKFTLVSQRCVKLQNVNNYCTASIRMEKSVDYEEVQEFLITVMATDRRKVRVTNTMTVTVIDRNDPPRDILLNGINTPELRVPEDQRSFDVASITTIDDDREDDHTYYLSGPAATNFRVEGTNLLTSSTADLDYETQNATPLTITVVDNGVPSQSFQKTFTVIIINKNEPPSDVMISNLQVSEESPTGSVVGELSAKDPDNEVDAGSQTFTFRLLDSARGRFVIRRNQVVVAAPSMRCGTELCQLNFEDEEEHRITVRVTDSGRPHMSMEKIFTIQVQDANDQPENLRLTTASVRENMPAGTIVGTLYADDEDISQTLVFEVVDSNLFMIHDSNHIATSQPLNYEDTFHHKVKIKVTDNGSPPKSMATTVTMTVVDVNEAPSFTSKSIVNIPEDVKIGTVVANISAVDPDVVDAVTFSINRFTESFLITHPTCSQQEGSTGTLCAASLLSLVKFDFVQKAVYPIPLLARDSKGAEIQQTLTILIENVNDPPHDILLDGVSTFKVDIDENVAPADVAILSTVDRDTDQTHTYSVVHQDGLHFAISGNLLRLSSPADHETSPEIHLTLRVTDSGPDKEHFEKNVTIIVRDVNEQPSHLALSNNVVPENSGQDTVVGTLIAEDPDNVGSETQLFTFSLLDSAGGRFRVKGDQLLVAQSNQECISKGGDVCYLNYESKKSFSIDVSVTDSGTPSKSNSFPLEIELSDANDPPTNIQLSGTSVEELAPAGTVIGSFSVEDEDLNQNHTFTLQDDTGGMFSITSENNLVKVTDDRLDNKLTYKVKVKVTDNGQPPETVERMFYLSVTGTTEAPYDVTLTSSDGAYEFKNGGPAIPEDAVLNIVIGTVTALDNDPDSVITFTLLDDADGHFKIETTSSTCKAENSGTTCSAHILLAKSLDVEKTSQHQIVVRAFDQDDMQASQSFTIDVIDVNEPPTNVYNVDGPIQVRENHNDAHLCVLTVEDPDRNDTHVFSLVDDAGGKFLISEIGELKTATDADLNYELTSGHHIAVKVADRGGFQLVKNFTVDVLDVNEKPTNLTINNTSISEMIAKGSVIGTLSVSDPDNIEEEVQSFEYELIDDVSGRFVLDKNVLKTAEEGEFCKSKGGPFCSFDYESKASYDVTVEVTDSGDPKLSEVFTLSISVLDINDKPTDVTLDRTTVPEDMVVNDVIGTLSASDQDRDQDLVFTVTGGTGAGFVKIEGTELKLNKTVDFEEHASLSLVVTVRDNGSHPAEVEKEFVLNIANVNERPQLMSIESHNTGADSFPNDEPVIDENIAEGTVVGQLVVLDPEKNEEISAISSSTSITIEKLGCITLTKGTRCVGNIKTEDVFDYEKQKFFTTNITVTDGGGNTLTNSFVFAIGDGNDPPQDMVLLQEDDGVIYIPENSKDKTIAEFVVKDPDVNQSHSFTVTSGPQFFYFVGNMLKVTTSADLNYEETSAFLVTLSVTDDGQPPADFEKQFEVKVTDVNEAPTSITISKNTVSEASNSDTVIGTLTTEDPDNLKDTVQQFTYSLLDDSSGRFKIDKNHLQTATSTLDHETSNSAVVRIKATDNGNPSLSFDAEFIIEITDSNDAPTGLRIIGNVVSENADIGTVVGTVSAEDEDSSQQLAFTMNTSNLLTVREDKILVNGLINFETDPEIRVTITATDDGDPVMSTTAVFVIKVSNENDAPTAIELRAPDGKSEVVISENINVGDVVGLVEVTDEDTVERITMTLVTPKDGTLKLDPVGPTCDVDSKKDAVMTVCSVKLLLGSPVNFETLPVDTGTVSLEVSATDKGGLTKSRTWKLPVHDTNDPPTDILIDGNITNIPENTPNFVIGALTTDDEDRKNLHIYQIVDNWDTFKVTSDNKLVVVSTLDFEDTTEYHVGVKTVDNGVPPMSFTKTFTFKVTNINEPPTSITLHPNEVSMASSAGNIVGFLEVTDPDNKASHGEKQTISCSTDSDLFYVDETDNSLKVQSTLPAEETTLTLSVTCHDNGVPSESLTSEVKVKVVETADVPKAVTITGSLEILENTAPVFVGKLSVVNMLNKRIISGIFTYSLVPGGSSTHFAVNESTLTLREALDYESGEEVEITVQVTGKDNKDQDVSAKDTFVVTVKDVNERPTNIGLYSDTVAENSPPGTIIGDLNTVDVDMEQTYTYTLQRVAKGLDMKMVDPELQHVFDIDGRTLVIGTSSQHLDYETTSTYSLLVKTEDSGTPSLSYTGTVRVFIQDRNDAPSAVDLDNNQVPENTPADSVIGILSVTDQDTTQTHFCEVVNIEEVPFKVVEDLKLVVARDELDFEKARNHVVKVICRDRGSDGTSLKISKHFTVNVTDVNEPPHNLGVSSTAIDENMLEGSGVGQLLASDPENDKIVFELVEPRDKFSIQGDSTLVADVMFNFEEVTNAQVTIKATDEQGLFTTETIAIKINDINEAPKSLSLSSKLVAENSKPGTLIGVLRTVDEDRSQTFTYSVTEDETETGHFKIVDNRLVTGDTPLDYEEMSSYHLTVTSTDSGVPSLSKREEFTITVEDINEPPTDIITKMMIPIPEDSEVGLVLTNITVEDEEVNQTYSCSVVETDAPFMVQTNIDGVLSLVLSNKLDFEREKTMTIRVTCVDGPFQITKELVVPVADINEAPTDILLDRPLLLPASGQPGYLIGHLSAVDPDSGQSHTFTVKGPYSDVISVKERTKLYLIKHLPMDRLIDQPTPVLEIAIKVIDNGQPSLSFQKDLEFPITDIDVNIFKLPNITIDNRRIKDDAKEGTFVGTLYNLNKTIGENVIFEIAKDDNNLFGIQNNTYLVLAQPLIGITSPSVKITIQARNTKTQQTTSRTITVFISSSMKCKKDKVDCHVDAKCITFNETHEHCKCNFGFVGDGYNCTDFDDCSNSTAACKNGGSCVDGLGITTCACLEGYTGSYCEINIKEVTPCTTNQCHNDALCIDDPDLKDYSCKCGPGWTGRFCEASIDECNTGTCYGNSTCIDQHRTYICICQRNRVGTRCEFLKLACSISSCKETCVPSFGGFGHQCVGASNSMLLKITFKPLHAEVVKALIVDFISMYGRFPVRPSSTDVASRRKRQTAPVSNVSVYISRADEVSPGSYEVEVLVQDAQDVVFSKEEVMSSLKDTCDSIGAGGQTETLLCPAIYQAVEEAASDEGDPESGSMSIGTVAGVAGGAAVLIIAIVVGVVCYRKRQRKGNDEGADELAADTRESSSRSSVPPAPPPPPPPKPPASSREE